MSTLSHLYARGRAKISRGQKPHDPSSSQGPIWKRKRNSQLQSNLIAKLPLEIRRLVYQHWISYSLSNLVHVAETYSLRPALLFHVNCIAELSAFVDNSSHFSAWGEEHQVCRSIAKEASPRQVKKRACLPLLTTCQQMYEYTFM
jgi:hypothetical protein